MALNLGGSFGGGSKNSSTSFSGTIFNSPFFSRLSQAYPDLLNYQYPTITSPQSIWGVQGSQFYLPGFNYAGGQSSSNTNTNNNLPPSNTNNSSYNWNPDPWGGMPESVKQSIQAGTATGKKYNAATATWDVTNQDPDLIWLDSGDGASNASDQYWYKDRSTGAWYPTPFEQVNTTLSSGPTAWNNWYSSQKQEDAKWGGMDNWARQALTNGTASGLKWNGSTWENSNNPDIVLLGDENTGKYYYKQNGSWSPITKSQVDTMKAGGPSAFTNTTNTNAPQGANRKWRKSDVAYAYQQLGPESSRKLGDLDRIWDKAGLDSNGSYSIADIRNAFDKGGDWTGSSRGIFESSMQYLTDQGDFLDSLDGNNGTSSGGIVGSAGGMYNNTANPPDAPEAVLEAIGKGTATGISWDAASRTWKQTTGNPDLVWWAPTNQLFYRGYSLTPEEYNYLLANGPGAADEYDSYRRSIFSSPDLSNLDPNNAPKATAPTVPYQTLPTLPTLKAPTVTAAQGPGDIPFLNQTLVPDVQAAQITDNFNVDNIDPATLNFDTSPEFFKALLSKNFDPANQQLDYQKDLENRKVNASLSARGLGTSAAAEGTLSQVNERYERLRNEAKVNATANATVQFYDYNFKKASEEAQLRQQARLGNQQAQLQIQNLNAQKAQTNAQFTQQAFLAKAGYQMQAITQDQQNALQVASLNLQKNLQQQQMQNEINLANAGFDFQAQTEMLKSILTGNLAQLESNTQVGMGNAQLGMQAQQLNMQQYAQLVGLSTNAMMEIRNQMLQGMGLTQQDMARMDNYTLQALSMMLQDKYNFIASIINAGNISGSRAEGKSTNPTSINVGLG